MHTKKKYKTNTNNNIKLRAEANMIYYNLFVFQRSKTVKPHTRTRISILYKYMCVYLIHNNTTRKRYFIYIYI